jgi:hypothetical protein
MTWKSKKNIKLKSQNRFAALENVDDDDDDDDVNWAWEKY